MINRCYRTTSKDYPNYGGRGIRVCRRWCRSFEAFYSDMGPKPTPLHQLERINVNGNYVSKNCKWATKTEQMRNRRDSVFLEFRGRRLTLAGWAEYLNIPHMTILQRHHRGWSIEKTLQPVSSKYTKSHAKLLTHNGKTQNISAWARELDIPHATIWQRIYRQRWSVEQALRK